MLVLKRKIGESLVIGEDIEVVVLEKEGDTVKIGIRAPRAVAVYRKEIFDEIKSVNQSAMEAPLLGDLLQQYRKNMKNDEK